MLLEEKTKINDEIALNNIELNMEKILKNFPFSYYNSQLLPDFQEMLTKKMDSLSLKEDLKNKSEMTEKEYYSMIESKIKTKYNMLMPAIYLVLRKGEYSIKFTKEDLTKVIVILILVLQ
jgi:hypothetical protein